MKIKALSLLSAAVLVLALGSMAKADTLMYCTGASSTSCFSSTSGLTDYWTVDSNLVLNTSTTFTYTLTVSYTNGDGLGDAGNIVSFSDQAFSQDPTALAWVLNPGGWAAPAPGKGQGACNGSATGSFCGAGTGVGLGSPAVFELTGDYTAGTANDTFNFQLASQNSNGKGFALAISCTPTVNCDGTTPNNPVPEPGSLALFGTGALGLAGYLRRKLFA